MSKSNRELINEALTLARLYWGYSQVEMAEALGMSQAMVSEIERGSKSVTLETLERYSEALGVKKSQLMFFAEEIEDDVPVRRGRLIIARKALDLLEKLKPSEHGCAQTPGP
ncbi:helix-turn-helix domain-containing protein [Roseobacter litoralis]|uniref:HTH-type transcriptional regulator-like protein n=1 Tax=Roseobacter litoralis (strain ATCC 49566 / DSM 6996 / JCM 21268 / NBRC 15278 / OCh 149) TaxID=391595 RepID=F7ZAR0_ROSLO|nr:helix-turn-helix transcriptional regulator [Roseobacter litoralis]AEI94256.1 HTH-type transcriptional regulator-like protein [Roseobacter litoralis Och 149]